jgi:hypothetical protein
MEGHNMAKTEKSASWALGEAIALGGGMGKGGGGVALYSLIDVDNQIRYGLLMGSAGISGGIPFQLTFAERGVYSFFTTSQAIPATDFMGFVYFGSVLDFSLGAGLSVINSLTFGGVDHAPYWIDTSGLENGISFSVVGISIGFVFVGDPMPNTGCDIRPAGDPWCGGYTPNPNYTPHPNQSK